MDAPTDSVLGIQNMIKQLSRKIRVRKGFEFSILARQLIIESERHSQSRHFGGKIRGSRPELEMSFIWKHEQERI